MKGSNISQASDTHIAKEKSYKCLGILTFSALAMLGSTNASSIPISAGADVGSYFEDGTGPVYFFDQNSVELAVGNVANISGCQGVSATGVGCYSAYSTYGAWGSQVSISNSSPSTIGQVFEGVHAGTSSRDILTISGIAPGTYTLIPTVTLDGTSSWNTQWISGTQNVAFAQTAGDGITDLNNGFFDVSTNIFHVTATLMAIEFVVNEPFNFQIGFGQTVRIFQGPDSEENTFVEGNFFSTMHVTGLEIFDTTGQSISGYTIESESGARYTASGVALVPTPATLALFGLGLATLSWSRRKKV